ncbi:MAG: helix-turn-helix transcriptional regulator [Desulfomonilaceae bacterium]
MKSIKVDRSLKKIGLSLQKARKRRSITTALMAERLGISRGTLVKLEKGYPGISIETFLTALMVLDKLDEVVNLLENDPLGIALMDQNLPKRVRIKK